MRERLAALAHRQWVGWMKYMLGKSIHHPDGSVTIPASLAARWWRQVCTPYDDLPESEKESDRHEADRVIGVILTRIATVIALGLEAE